MGYLAGAGCRPASAKDVDANELRRAVIYGSVMGSFCCERFGVDRFRTLTRQEIDAPLRRIQRIHVVLAEPFVHGSPLFRRERGASWPPPSRIFYRTGATLYLRRCRSASQYRAPHRRFAHAGLVAARHHWLPLPHLLMIPLVRNDWLWQTGLAGAIVSGVCHEHRSGISSSRPCSGFSPTPPPPRPPQPSFCSTRTRSISAPFP